MNIFGKQCLVFHSWGPWKAYNHNYQTLRYDLFGHTLSAAPANKVDARQFRACVYCGKHQDVLIKENLEIPYGAR